MNAQEFTNLYTKRKADETLTPFQDEMGFSLVRYYPDNTPYERDGRRMFIKVAILERGFFYEVNMTKPEQHNERAGYILTDGEEYKKKVTNFTSDIDSKEFYFDESAKKIIHSKTKKQFSLNEFVDILESNHLSDRLFLKRKINSAVEFVLKVFFWLVDRHYERTKVFLDIYKFKKGEQVKTEEKQNIDPFFKYFYITKNTLFVFLLFTTLGAVLWGQFWPFGDFSVSNPAIVLLFFLALSLCEKFSLWLSDKIQDFLFPDKDIFTERKVNFVEKMHEYQQRNKFNLKLK